MAKTLVIVESPTKARTIEGFLDSDVVVESSMGHVRDLPRNSAEIPEKVRSEPWSKLGVDVEHDFQPLYIVPKEKADQIRRLKKAMEGIDELFLATDEDREGESIAWHLTEVLGPKVPVRRMVFHEITPRAIQEAFANPRQIDQRLVEAQETRRVLDRLVGYEVSPVLWRMIQPRLSAGRVQSVAVRLVVQREWERIRFRSGAYWDVAGTSSPRVTANFPSRQPSSRSTDAGSRPGATSTPAEHPAPTCSSSTDERPPDLATACSGGGDLGAIGGAQAIPAEPLSPISHFDAATGGGEEARASPHRAPCRRRSGSTSGGTSPTCGPTASPSPSRR